MAVVPVLETIHEMLAEARAREGNVAPFDPTTSPLHGKAIFVVGAPRSGTTWLHQLLATHPDVATGGEAHLFCEGVSGLLRNHDDPDPHMKLSTWLPRAELLGLVRAFTDGVFDTARRVSRPGATRVLDKTPNHVPYAADLAEVYPDATFVHIIRDGRDSAGSAKDLWSAWDARSTWGAAAARWRDAVLDCRRHLAHLAYHEVRYEDLVQEPEKRFAEVLEAARLDYDDDYVAAAVQFGRAPINVRPSDARVGVRKWEGTDPRGERAVVVEAGDLLVELGYLDEEERARVVADKAWQDVAADGAATARTIGVRALQAARRRVAGRASGPTPSERRQAAERLLTATVAGTDLPATTVEVDGAPSSPSWLTGRIAGGRLAAVDADTEAAAVQVVAPDGARLIVRLFGDPDRPDRVVVQGT